MEGFDLVQVRLGSAAISQLQNVRVHFVSSAASVKSAVGSQCIYFLHDIHDNIHADSSTADGYS